MSVCNDCPRSCGVDRSLKTGYCGATLKIKIARASLHKWEEPFISGKGGSGTVFFSHCNLKCVFCQNCKISCEGYGKEITEKNLYDVMARLADGGAENINLVTPTHYAKQLLPVLKKFKHNFNLPIVYNCGGYESVKMLKNFEGLIDVWLPDMKYADAYAANKLSFAKDYPQVNLAAVYEMKRQQPEDIIIDGVMQKGVVIRHLIMPNLTDQSIKILDIVKNNFGINTYVSLMSQYQPFNKAAEFKELNRKITERELDRVVGYALSNGFINAFTQDLSAADEKFVPSFDLSGI